VNEKNTWTDAVFTKTYKVSRKELFSAWSNEKKVALWWGPYGFTNPVCRWDAKARGDIYIQMTAPDGMVFPLKGFFYEVITPEQLVFVTRAFEDGRGNVQLEVLTSVILTELQGRTKLTVETTVMRSTPEVYCFFEIMHEGWKQSLKKLEKFLFSNSIQQGKSPIDRQIL
jgi:uncharacterized protein YndB with AHSA1/START domain